MNGLRKRKKLKTFKFFTERQNRKCAKSNSQPPGVPTPEYEKAKETLQTKYGGASWLLCSGSLVGPTREATGN